MRELKDYTAELHRRIEETQAQQRRTRRRIAALCVPLALALAVTGAVTLPKLARRGGKTAEPQGVFSQTDDARAEGVLDPGGAIEPDLQPEQDYPEGDHSPSVMVFVTGKNGTASAAMLPSEQAARVCALVQSVDPAVFDPTEGPSDGVDGTEVDPQTVEEVVQIQLSGPGGQTAAYTLEGMELVRDDTGERFALNQAQYDELTALIGTN